MTRARAVDHPHVTVEDHAHRTVATLLLRRVTGGPAEDATWRTLSGLLPLPDSKPLCLDCRQVQHLSSAGLGRLVTLAIRGRDGGTRVVLCNLCPSLRSIVRLLRLDTCLEIEPDGSSEGGHSP